MVGGGVIGTDLSVTCTAGRGFEGGGTVAGGGEGDPGGGGINTFGISPDDCLSAIFCA